MCAFNNLNNQRLGNGIFHWVKLKSTNQQLSLKFKQFNHWNP